MPHYRPHAVVAGAGSGLGRGSALRSAQRGHDLAVGALLPGSR